MVVNKENMVNMLTIAIKHEEKNTFNTPMENEHDAQIWKDGYKRALENLLYAISVNGE